MCLGRVDGFDQHKAACKTDDGGVADVGFFAAHGNALEPLELADGLFDARSESIETLRKKAASLLGVFATRDHRRDATRKRGGAICVAVISLIGHRNARANVRTDVERGLELSAVARLAWAQVEVERMAVEIGFEVDFGREAATRAAEGLMLLPPFAPAAET